MNKLVKRLEISTINNDPNRIKMQFHISGVFWFNFIIKGILFFSALIFYFFGIVFILFGNLEIILGIMMFAVGIIMTYMFFPSLKEHFQYLRKKSKMSLYINLNEKKLVFNSQIIAFDKIDALELIYVVGGKYNVHFYGLFLDSQCIECKNSLLFGAFFGAYFKMDDILDFCEYIAEKMEEFMKKPLWSYEKPKEISLKKVKGCKLIS